MSEESSNKSTMPYDQKVKEIGEKIDYILKQYGCGMRINLQPANWVAKFLKRIIKVNAGMTIMEMRPQQPAPTQTPVTPTPQPVK